MRKHPPTIPATILVVDDLPQNLLSMNALLSGTYLVKVAPNGARALAIARSDPPPDLILLDIMMPGMDGFEVCRQLKADPETRDIAVIFLTAKDQTDDEQLGFDLGAVDYITKPISAPVALARIKTHLKLKAFSDFLIDKSAYLEQEVERRTKETASVQDITVLTMASLAETRDNETGNHIYRTQNYVRLLAEALADHPRFSEYLTPDTVNVLFKSAPLHDVGKVGIPDRILLKPGRLEPDEFEIMKQHPAIGRGVIESVEMRLGHTVPFLQCAKEIAYSHQEKWDGSGYPQALRGDQIPISARLMAVADVYDALISKRVYKAAFSHEAAVNIILEGRNHHFDPDIVDAFERIQLDFQDVAQLYVDHE